MRFAGIDCPRADKRLDNICIVYGGLDRCKGGVWNAGQTVFYIFVVNIGHLVVEVDRSARSSPGITVPERRLVVMASVNQLLPQVPWNT